MRGAGKRVSEALKGKEARGACVGPSPALVRECVCVLVLHSDLLLFTDVFRSLLLFGETPEVFEDWGVILAKMTVGPRTLCKHNIAR